jgi:hypothetical protein
LTKKDQKYSSLYGDGTSILVEQTSKMSFMPKAIIATGVLGAVVPACDISYLEADMKKRRSRSVARKTKSTGQIDPHLRTSLPTGGLDLKNHALKGKTIYGLSYNSNSNRPIQPNSRPMRHSISVSPAPFATTSFSNNHVSEHHDQYVEKRNKYDLREYAYIKRDDKQGSFSTKAAWDEVVKKKSK